MRNSNDGAELMIHQQTPLTKFNTTLVDLVQLLLSPEVSSRSSGKCQCWARKMLLSVSTAYRAGGFSCFPVIGCFCNYFLYIPTGCRSCDVHAPLPEYWWCGIKKKQNPLCEVDGILPHIHGDFFGFKGKRIRCGPVFRAAVWGHDQGNEVLLVPLGRTTLHPPEV